MAEKELLSVKETAEMLGIACSTIYNKTSKKSEHKFPIPYIKVGRMIKFEKRDITSWLDQNKAN
jgi:excisionase family DNA binding protein